MSTPINIAQIKLTDAEIDAATAVLRSGGLRQGKECEAFENEFAAAEGAQFGVTCANGSAANQLGYMAGLEPGDEILVPAFTFIASAMSASVAQIKPIFCDVDPDTYLIDLEDAAKRITPKTRGIAPVHLFGNCVDPNAVQAFADKHNLFVAYDVAQAHGTTFNGQRIGGFGDVSTYSFYPTKNMFVGEGGMITTNNEDYAQKMRDMRSHGQTGRYIHTIMGYNYRMTDVEAAIGRVQLQRLDEMVATRRRNAAILNEGLGQVTGIKTPTVTPGCESSWHQYSITVEADFGISRDDLAAKLAEKSIGTGVHYPRGLHQQPVYEELQGKQTLPVCEMLSEKILALPVHHALSAEDCQAVVDAIAAARG